ncbi:MAG: hypothetical protein JO099_20910 [Acidobacteriia bacterium]|nr:hypothetical protein [Terriglobia bacterium]
MTATGNAWQQAPTPQPEQDHYSRVAVAIQRAKATGLNQLILSSPLVMKTGVRTVNDLIRDYSLLRFTVVDAVSTVDDQNVQTWYKLSVVDVLSRQAQVRQRSLPLDTPRALLPLGGSEVLFVVTGGTAVVDGITVTESPVDTGLVLHKDRQYVGGFLLEASGQLAETAALSASLYEISNNEDLTPLGSPEDPLVRDFRDYVGNRLSTLRNTIGRQVPDPITSLR